MAETNANDAENNIKNNLGDIHRDWQQLREQSTTGQKAWLTQMKNHYFAIVRENPDAAAELLAMYEHQFSLIRKDVHSAIKKSNGTPVF